jgi:hypothetical protein
VGQISKSIWFRPKNDYGDRQITNVLLKRQISINGHENVERRRRKSDQLAILDARPTHLARRLDIVTHDVAR